MERQQSFSRSDISGATIRSTSKRRTAMKILLYLEGQSMPHTIGEVSDGLDILYETANYNLNRLTDCGFIERMEDRMDGRTRHFQIINKEAVEQAIVLYKRMVGFKLARLIPPTPKRIFSEQLSHNPRFVDRCKFYGITPHEGIGVLATCYKINTQPISDLSGRSKGLFFSRNDPEGYEYPEEEKSERKPSIDEKQTEPEDI